MKDSRLEKVLLFTAGAATGVVALSLYSRRRRQNPAAKPRSTSFGSSVGTPEHRRKTSEDGSGANCRDGVRGRPRMMDELPVKPPPKPYQHEAKMKLRLERSLTPIPMQRSASGTGHGDFREEIREAVMAEAAQERTKVTVKVPATSANMGPGYDCLGMAVDIWSIVTVERSDKFEIVYEGDGYEEVPLDESNYLVVGLKSAFASANKPVPKLRYHCVNRIPYARGLGSSSAAIVAGLIAGLALAGHKLPCWGSEELLQLACEIEGHPDNVAPVIYGGCQLGIHNGDRWQTERVNMPAGIQVVLFIPDFIGKTSTARAVLDSTISRADAGFSLGRVAWLVNALSSGNLDNLKNGFQDKMHQPQRGKKVYKYLDAIIAAAVEAGACGAYLSGAGPTVAAMTSGASGDIFTQREAERVDKQVAEAMLKAADAYGVKGQVRITTPTQNGAVVVSAMPPYSGCEIKFPGDA